MPIFDGETLIMTLDAPIGGTLTQNVKTDWYSAWKDWQLSSPINRKYPPAFFDSFGGNQLTESVDAGAYFIFQNNRGWRIKPYESDHTVYVVGNVAPSDSTIPMSIPTDGAYTVFFDGLQPITQNIDSIINEQSTNVKQIMTMIEMGRPHHVATGDKWYWDPYGGDDLNNGKTKDTACKTFAHIHDNLVTSNNHDVVFYIPGDPSGETVADEAINITKNYVFLRGTGRDSVIEPLSSPEDCIHITGEGCEISGLLLRTSDIGIWNAIHVSGGNFPYIRSVWVDNASGDGYYFDNCSNIIIEGGYLKGIARHGMNFADGVDHAWVDANGVHGAGGNGVHIEGAGTYEIKIMDDMDIHWCTGYGVYNANNSLTKLGVDITIENNTAGDIYDPNNKIVYEGRVTIIDKLDDLHDEALGKWALDPTGKTLTLYRKDGVTVLTSFTLSDTQASVPAFIERTPV